MPCQLSQGTCRYPPAWLHGHSTHIDKLALLSPDLGPLCRKAEAADDEDEDEDEDDGDEDDEDDVQAQFFQVCRALRRHYSHSCLIWKCRDVVSFAFLPLLWLQVLLQVPGILFPFAATNISCCCSTDTYVT